MNLIFLLLLSTSYYDDYGVYDEGSGNEPVLGNIENLRSNLFQNYSIDTRPVINYSDSVNLHYGIEIVSLDYFDQKAESIELNVKMIYTWNDQYLNWHIDNYGVEYIPVDKTQIWTPDLELYNSASKPVVYDQTGMMKLYHTGDVIWVLPVRYQFSCKLNLERFPFDSQTCTMLFGSWKFSKTYFDLQPFYDDYDFANISVSEHFYHNEWEITNISCSHQDIEYLCCPGELWPNTEFSITLTRSYHKYLVVMIMSFVLILTGLVVSLMSMKYYRRFYILVFIPLTIIWLQVYIAGKIPVIEYATTLEEYLVLCFTTTMLCTFESGIIYNLLNYEDTRIKEFINKNLGIIKVFDLLFRSGVIISFIVGAAIYMTDSN